MLLWLALSLLLPAGVRTDVTCPAAPQNALNFTDIPQQPAGRVTSDAGALAPLYGFVKSFLGCVQPNPFPEELLRKLLNNEGVDVTKESESEVRTDGEAPSDSEIKPDPGVPPTVDDTPEVLSKALSGMSSR
ncbi:UNVERIFIED_CONTAM: hypothetical protein FKN15_014370 [Acipenser sinensis]